MSTRPTTVYVVDDEARMRRALARLLEAEGFAVKTFGSAREFLAAYQLDEIACLILDVAMPGVDGLELQRQLAGLGADLPIIFLTARGSIRMSVQAMKAGALDFLTKPVLDADLLYAVRAALSNAERRRAVRSATGELAARHATLTPREREVLALVAAGMLNKQIAAALGTGVQNIKLHRARVMSKMGVESLADLVRAAEKLGIRGAPGP